MTEKHEIGGNVRLEREMASVIESQKNLVETMKRIESKMDERHSERFKFETDVRLHITEQGNYQELIEKHEDFIDVHVKPSVNLSKKHDEWITNVGQPAVDEINKVKFLVRGASVLATLSAAVNWKAIASFFKNIG